MNLYHAAKAFALQIGAGDVKVKHEGDTSQTANVVDAPF
jgi:hypothetical protein